MSSSRPTRRCAAVASDKLRKYYTQHSKRTLETSGAQQYTNNRKHSSECNHQITANGDRKSVIRPSGLNDFPRELLDIVFQNLCPSQLVTVERVSSQFYSTVKYMSLWKKICAVANLPKPKRRGKKYKTYRDMVMTASKRICEWCFTRCKRPMVYDLPLPVFVEHEKRSIRLCLLCRREYFKRNPEPIGPNDDPFALARYGGHVGVNAYLNRLYRLRERRQERLRPGRDERRSILRAAFAAVDILEFDETEPQILDFIRNGTSPDNREMVLQRIINSVRSRQEVHLRHRELVQRLAAHGLQVWNNLQLCKAYVERNEGNLNDIVTFMVETDWFLQYTEYKSLRRVTTYECIKLKLRLSDMCGVDNEQGKMRALRKYVEKRIESGHWNDISLDPDSPLRPPKSLWPNIRALNTSVWLEIARSKFLISGIRECQDLLFSLNPMNPSELSIQLFAYILDRGAVAAITVESSTGVIPSISCSVALQNTIGEARFDAFVETNRLFVLDTAQKIFTDLIWDDLPLRIHDFSATCKMDSDMTPQRYSEREHEFIKANITEIASYHNVHRQYLVSLLKKMRQSGCMGMQLL